MTTSALLEAEAAEAMAARRLLTPLGVRIDVAQPKDLADYRTCRARAEELRSVLTDHMRIAGHKEWGGNYGRATTRRPIEGSKEA